MDFLPDDDQLALVSAAADVLTKELPALRESASSPLALARNCAALGWFGLGVPEADGGVGATLVDEVLLFREIGRHLAPGPLLSTLLGARVALAAGETALAESIMSGARLVSTAERAAAPLIADAGDRWRVFDAPGTDLALVLAPGVARLVSLGDVEPLRCIDESTALAAVELDAADAVASAPVSEPILHLGWVLLAAMLTGITEATRDMSVAYLKDREQFGKPIGTFQSLKHRAADMAVDAEKSWSVTTYAALALHEHDHHAPLYCMSARVVAQRAAMASARANVQHHGAMGTTFEHDAHRFVKRAHVLDHLLGGTDAPLAAILDQPSPLAATR